MCRNANQRAMKVKENPALGGGIYPGIAMSDRVPAFCYLSSE